MISGRIRWNGQDHWPPSVDGDEIRWVELFRMLRAVAYPGDVNFEPAGYPGALTAVAGAPERIVEMEARTL